MREILFKAKRKDNGEWIEGYLFDNGFDGEEKKYFVGGLIIEKYNGTACDEWDITGIDFCEIVPETLCQFTGLCDKNGNKIWENDILRFTQQDETKIGVIKYNAPIFTYFGLMRWSLYKDEVIGNIFDNPELLQEESDE